MALGKAEFLETVLAGYAQNYDIERTAGGEEFPSLAAKAALHVAEEGYILIKKAKTWSADSDEYVYFFLVDRLDDDYCEKAIGYAYENGMSRIDLSSKSHHMCTRITTVFVADEIDEAALDRIRKCKLYKMFMFSLKGWMEFHTAAADLSKGITTGNRYGQPTAKYLNEVLHPQPRRESRRGLGLFKKSR